MKEFLLDAFICFAGFAEGAVSGGSIIAFIVILEVIPRLCELSKTERYTDIYDDVMVIGAVVGSLSAYFHPQLRLGYIMIIILGMISGTFVGILAGALADTLDVIPIILKRIGVDKFVIIFVIAITTGKVIGAILNYCIPGLGGK